jgi:hypothetical protein
VKRADEAFGLLMYGSALTLPIVAVFLFLKVESDLTLTVGSSFHLNQHFFLNFISISTTKFAPKKWDMPGTS